MKKIEDEFHEECDIIIENMLKKYRVVETELILAEILHPNYPADMFRQLAIMQEEAGEVTKAVLDYHYSDGSFEEIKKELVQTAAMCMRMLVNLKEK